MDTKSLIAKLDDVAKTVDLDVSTILAEQYKDPMLGTVRSWIRKRISPEPKTPEIQQSKGLLRYCQEVDRLLIEEEGQLLCYNEPTDKLDDENLRIRSTFITILSMFRTWTFQRNGADTWEPHRVITMQNDSTTGLVCLIGYVHLLLIVSPAQNNKPKPKHKNEVPLEEWQNETYSFPNNSHRS